MNYKYKVDDTEVILSTEEHEAVKKAFEAGKSPVYLRAGSLAINKSFVRYVRETEQSTAVEEKAHEEYLALPPDKRSGPVYLPKARGGGLKQALGGSGMKECAKCKEWHFIPENKNFCLKCLKGSKPRLPYKD